MEQQNLSYSKQKLIQVVNAHLKKLKNSSTIEDLRKTNEFLKETRAMAETIQFINSVEETPELVEECDVEHFNYDESHMNIVDFIAEGCDLIIALNNVKDLNRIKEGNLQWITNEAFNYLEEAREIFGSRIPVPPNVIRMSSIE